MYVYITVRVCRDTYAGMYARMYTYTEPRIHAVVVSFIKSRVSRGNACARVLTRGGWGGDVCFLRIYLLYSYKKTLIRAYGTNASLARLPLLAWTPSCRGRWYNRRGCIICMHVQVTSGDKSNSVEYIHTLVRIPASHSINWLRDVSNVFPYPLIRNCPLLILDRHTSIEYYSFKIESVISGMHFVFLFFFLTRFVSHYTLALFHKM